MVQLEASKSSIKDLFKELLYKIKDFKYQITVNVLLRRNKEDGDIEFAPVYFSSATKTVINFDKYMFDNLFKKLFTGWIIRLMKGLGG